MPTLRVLGGTGAILRPVIGRIPESKPGQKLIKVIDCVYSKNSGLVGYVNGKPYYGPFHEHPLKGVKMVGAVHINEPHEIIYDTLEESLKKSSNYIIKSGDTLWGIAQLFQGISVVDIKKLNNITSNTLKPGTKIKIPKI